MQRRKFLTGAGGGLVAAGAAAVLGAPNVIARPSFQWRMATTWPPTFDILVAGARRFATMVEELSGGRFKIEVFTGGELVPAFAVFDESSRGTIEMYHSAAYYWGGKEPATQWFANVPFGLNAQGAYAWYYQGDGLKLWEETYAPFGLLPRPGGSTGVQMGGWFRKRINTLADFKGLKLRMPGLGGKVLAKAGATPMVLSMGDAIEGLGRGVIDAVEFVGPHDDLTLGFHRVARYYYYPGWHEPGGTTEFAFNKKAYDSLPLDLQRVLDYAAIATHALMVAEYETKNALALKKLRTEFKDKVEILAFPAQVMKQLKRLAGEVTREQSEKSPMAKRVYASYTNFQAILGEWGRISEGAYHKLIAG